MDSGGEHSRAADFQEVWDAVQRMDNHPARGRSGKSGTVSLFGGLLRVWIVVPPWRYMRDYRKKVSTLR